jgi:hypothetical protein
MTEEDNEFYYNNEDNIIQEEEKDIIHKFLFIIKIQRKWKRRLIFKNLKGKL